MTHGCSSGAMTSDHHPGSGQEPGLAVSPAGGRGVLRRRLGALALGVGLLVSGGGAAGLSSPALAQTAAAVAVGPIAVLDVWARASAGLARAGGVFLFLRNEGDQPDRLIAAASPVAAVVELHTHRSVAGMMQMRAVPAIDLPARGMVQLRPGGLHVMLIDLAEPLVEGQTFPVTLTFERAGSVTVTATVLDPGAMGPGHMQGMGRLGGGAGGGLGPGR